MLFARNARNLVDSRFITKSFVDRNRFQVLQWAGFKRLVVKRNTPNFREAVEVVESDLRKPAPDEVVLKNLYVGINASDINYSAGRYDPRVKPPYDVGFESIGVIEEAGSDCKPKKGQPYAYFGSPPRAFAEYIYAKEKELIPLTEAKPELIALMLTGMTAAIGLDVAGSIKEGEKVLVTAAAGGVGHIAVQWAKARGCHVIGTCSSQEKADFLEKMGCDHVINYKKEDIKQVLAKKYPGGVDVVWETMGGPLTETFLNSLATKGRLVIVGAISGYKDSTGSGFPAVNIPDLPVRLLTKSRTMCGFFLPDYSKLYKEYFMKLLQSYLNKELKIVTDTGLESKDGKFTGIEGIYRAVEHLHKGLNKGKVIVEL